MNHPLSKQERYQKLVADRQEYVFDAEGIVNPTDFKIANDSHLNSWANWCGNLDAKIMLIGQDFGDEKYYKQYNGLDNPNSVTNANLRKLFAASGINVGNIDENHNKRLPLYFTNAILGAKTEGGMAGAVKRSWYKDTAEQFTKPLIDLVQPKVIVTMGATAYDLVSMLYGLPKQKMKEAIESGPKELSDGIQWHVAAHCSGLGLVNRKFEQQEADWARMNLRRYL